MNATGSGVGSAFSTPIESALSSGIAFSSIVVIIAP